MALRPCKECGKQISNEAAFCPYCGRRVEKRRGIGLGGAFLVVIVAGMMASVIINATKGNNPSGNNPPVDPKQAALSEVKLSYKWTKEDGLMTAYFTVKNDSGYDIKDLEIKCVHYGRSGTAIDSNTRTIYDVVSARSTKNFPHFNMGFIHSQAVQSGCGITDLAFVK